MGPSRGGPAARRRANATRMGREFLARLDAGLMKNRADGTAKSLPKPLAADSPLARWRRADERQGGAT